MTDLGSFELINIFKAMISIVKVELINATENYLLNIFFVTNIFPTYLSHSHLVKIKGYRYNMDKDVVQHIE